MKSLISVLSWLVLLTLFSESTLANQFTFESSMPYQRGSCIDPDRVVLMNDLTYDAVQIPVSLDGTVWNNVAVRNGDRKVFITVMRPQGNGVLKQSIFIKLDSSVELHGGEIYSLQSNGNSLNISRIRTTCRQGRLVQIP